MSSRAGRDRHPDRVGTRDQEAMAARVESDFLSPTTDQRPTRQPTREAATMTDTDTDTDTDTQTTDADKAIAQAKVDGQAEERAKYGTRLARTQFDALAGRRNPDFDTASTLDHLDLTRFIGEDGEPDDASIKAAVECFIPAPTEPPPSFDGGARTTPPRAKGMNELIRRDFRGY